MISYTSIKTILSKFQRDLREPGISEGHLIDWTGEALGFLKLKSLLEQKVAFAEVINNEAFLPEGLEAILQVARNNKWPQPDVNSPASCKIPEVCQVPEDEIVVEETPCETTVTTVTYYKPFYSMHCPYTQWVQTPNYADTYSPVRLANHSFFNSIVCKEKNQVYSGSCVDEYTIIGTIERKLRFSFEEGYVAIAYLARPLDEDGLPLIPDNISTITAIVYYIKWKLAERYDWDGREGFTSKAKEAKASWDEYILKAKNRAKMPQSLDQMQNMLEETHSLIPRLRKYHGFYGNLGRGESRKFTDSARRNRNY